MTIWVALNYTAAVAVQVLILAGPEEEEQEDVPLTLSVVALIPDHVPGAEHVLDRQTAGEAAALTVQGEVSIR